jgi:hypothetical protein
MNPPTMTVAPFGIIGTASSAETDFMLEDSRRQGRRPQASLGRAPRMALICIKGRPVGDGCDARSDGPANGARATDGRKKKGGFNQAHDRPGIDYR